MHNDLHGLREEWHRLEQEVLESRDRLVRGLQTGLPSLKHRLPGLVIRGGDSPDGMPLTLRWTQWTVGLFEVSDPALLKVGSQSSR